MAKPKLALIPAAQGSDKLFSVLPSSGVGDFDFIRPSSATRINSQGLIETVGNGVSRLNYPMIDGKVVGCPHHILEPSRTNLITYSEAFDNAAWNKINTTIQSDESISPNGSLNASKLSTNNSNGVHIITDALTGSLQMTYSVFFKKGEYKYGSMSLINGGNSRGSGVVIDLDTFQVVSSQTSSSSFTFKADNYGNGWIRCELTVNNTNSIISLAVIGSWNGIGSVTWNSGFRTPSYIGDSSKGVYIYGAQLEQGSYPTSYIPTNGTTVTRSAETANNSGDADTFNDSEGVLMLEASSNSTTSVIWSVTDGSNSNAVSLYYGSQGVICDIFSSVGVRTLVATMPIKYRTNMNKFSIKYKSNDIGLWLNGYELAVNTQTISLSGLNELEGAYGSGSFPFYGSAKQIQYYDSALTDSELEQLTSWTSFTDMAEGQLYTIQ